MVTVNHEHCEPKNRISISQENHVIKLIFLKRGGLQGQSFQKNGDGQ